VQSVADDVTVEQAIDRAHMLLRERRYMENRAFLEDAVRRFPRDPEVRVMYATALEPFAPDRVREELDIAIALDPESAWNLVRGASLLFSIGDMDGSRDYAARAHGLPLPSVELGAALANLAGQLADADGKPDIAEDAFRGAVEFDPQNRSYARDLVMFLVNRKRYADALTAVDAAISQVDDNAELTELRAVLLKQMAADR
jgi:tetratricopeptide (TPR) repeat protein